MDYDLALHNTRVLNDEGSVPNPIQAESYIKYLKENNLWDSCVFFGLGGSKIDSNGYCSKLYDLKGNADILSTAQPKHNQDGSLLFNGTQWLRSSVLSVDNPIRLTIEKFTVVIWVKLGANDNQAIFTRNADGSNNRAWYIYSSINTTGKVLVGVVNGSSIKTYTINKDFISDMKLNHVAFTFDGTAMSGNGYQGKLSCYLNGVFVGESTSTVNLSSTGNVTAPLEIGSWYNGSSTQYLEVNSKVALPQIYNTILTDAQILNNFNNIKQTDISETYGSLTGAQINRVESSFGVVPYSIKTQEIVDKLKANNLWDSCVFFTDCRIGVRKDSNQFINALFDLKNNANPVQATGTAQPKYDTDGSILYDGDKLMTGNLLTSNPIAQCTNAITVVCWVNIVTIGTQFIFDRYSTTGGQDVWFLLQTSTGTMRAQVRSTPMMQIKEYETVSTIGSGWKCLAFTYSVTNGMKLYINGTNQSVTKSIDNANVAMGLQTSPLALGQRTGSTLNPYLNGNKTALHQIYNVELTDAQMLWNFDNIKPEGV